MPIDLTLRAMLLDSVTRYAWASTDVNGQHVHSETGTALACRVTYRTRAVTARDRGEQVSSTTIIFGDVIPWDSRDRLVLPNGTEPEILEIRRYKDERGIEHEEVLT